MMYYQLVRWESGRAVEVATFPTFDDAMKSLAERDGEWKADWSLQSVHKGNYTVRVL